MPSTRTATDAGHSRLAVHAAPGRVRVHSRTDGPPDHPIIRPVLLHSDERGARVSLVPEGALLLDGDHVRIDVEVGAGAHLELAEPGGTVAYDMRGGRARWDVHVTVAEGGSLVWHGEPFVVAAGASVDRRTTVRLRPGARLAVRETLVLGRHGEEPGALRQRCSVSDADGPVLLEELEVGPTTHEGLLGGCRALGTTLVHGLPVEEGPDTLLLASGGALVRRLGRHAHEVQPEGPWRRVVLAARG